MEQIYIFSKKRRRKKKEKKINDAYCSLGGTFDSGDGAGRRGAGTLKLSWLEKIIPFTFKHYGSDLFLYQFHLQCESLHMLELIQNYKIQLNVECSLNAK